MEFGTTSPESSPGLKPAAEIPKDTETSKEKKKKSTGSAVVQAEITAERRAPDPQRQGKVVESIWQKITGESDKNKTPDLPLFGIKKPEVAESGAGSLHKFAEADVIQPDVAPVETDSEGSPSDDAEAKTSPADAVEKAELLQAAQEFTEVRLNAADGELHEQPLDQMDTPEAAEAAAGAALMRAMQDSLRQNNDRPVSESLDAAERSVAESISAELPASEVPELIADAETNTGETPDSSEAEPVTEQVDYPEFHPENGDIPPMPPPLPPQPPQGPPSGPSGGASGPGFGGMPYPGMAPNAAPGFVSPNVLPAAAAATEAIRINGNERAAAAQGLLVGGIAGYFIGRRRGRKQGQAKAEKQLNPVQKTLEKQVKNLQETIAVKEQKIRQSARERIAAVSHSQDRRTFVEKLLKPEAAPKAAVIVGAAEAARPGVLQTAAELVAAPIVLAVEASRSTERATRPLQTPAEVLGIDRFSQENKPSIDVGRLLVEAPLAAVAAPIVAERQRAEQKSEQSKVVPFDKKAENFSREELLSTAEKIKVEGVTLKEMVELGRLDERALRRVTQEFLEGGNVSAAVAREVKEKELKFERDPRMRRAVGSAAAISAGASVAESDAVKGDSKTGAASSAPRPYDGPRPTPDDATLKAIREKQIVTVGTTTVVVILLIMILILLAR